MDFSEPWHDTFSKVGYAARLGNAELLEHFIKDKKPVNVADNRGWRPVHEAAATASSIECLEKLLKHSDTNINWTTHEGETALLLACKRLEGSNATSYVKMLLQYGADPNIRDNEEDTPLLEALRNENRDVVELLIAAGAHVNDTDCSRWSPLHEAATKKDPFFVQCLLKSNANIQMQDECGMTPIFTAAQHGSERCLETLLLAAKEKNQGNIVNIGAEDWATPLMIAAQQGFVTCVKILLENGADPDLMTSDNATALHLAVQGDNNVCLEILLERMNLQPLITAFHPLSYEEKDMICPLHLAIEWGSYASLKALLAAGFSPDSLYCCSDRTLNSYITYLPEHESAVSYAACKKDKTSLAILLAAGASCNPPIREAFHPLLRAMHNPVTDIFDILIKSGADVNYQRQPEGSNEVLLFSLLMTGWKYLQLVLYYGCDPNLCFSDKRGVFSFIRCAGRLLQRVALRDFLKLMSRFLLSSRRVHCAFVELNNIFPCDISDLLEELNQPSSLKLISTIKLRQHLYSIHGVKLPQVVQFLQLPPVLEQLVSCQDLKPPET